MKLSWNKDDTEVTLILEPREFFVIRAALKRYRETHSNIKIGEIAHDLVTKMERDPNV